MSLVHHFLEHGVYK